MIAFAITCLLVATTIVALLSAADSMLRGARHYRALAAQLRALQVKDSEVVDAAAATGGKRPAPTPRARRTATPRRAATTGLRAAA